MRIIESGTDRLVIENLDPKKRKFVARWMVVAVIVLCVMIKWIGVLLVPPIVLLCLMVVGFVKGKVTEYTFDRPSRELRITRKSMYGAASPPEKVPFADLQKITYRDASSSRSDRKIYQLIVTAASHNSLVIGATGDLWLCKEAMRRISDVVGRQPDVCLESPEPLTEQEEDSLEE
jgi:hypothetical protein